MAEEHSRGAYGKTPRGAAVDATVDAAAPGHSRQRVLHFRASRRDHPSRCRCAAVDADVDADVDAAADEVAAGGGKQTNRGAAADADVDSAADEVAAGGEGLLGIDFCRSCLLAGGS
jgi:hypothetical protein